MLWLYNLPGRLLANFWYLWPKRGQVWASARRKDHSFVHFLYSTLIYAGLIYIFLVPALREPRPRLLGQPAQARVAPEAASTASEGFQPDSQFTAPDAPANTEAVPARRADPTPPICSETVRDRCINPSEAPPGYTGR